LNGGWRTTKSQGRLKLNAFMLRSYSQQSRSDYWRVPFSYLYFVYGLTRQRRQLFIITPSDREWIALLPPFFLMDTIMPFGQGTTDGTLVVPIVIAKIQVGIAFAFYIWRLAIEHFVLLPTVHVRLLGRY
jgi:hypothetical protein